MNLVTRQFHLDNHIDLPKDTVVIEVPRLPSSLDTQRNCDACTDTSNDSEDFDSDDLLIVSPSAAAYFVVKKNMRGAIEALLAGKTVRQALDAIGIDRNTKSGRIDLMRDLLAHIEFRNFYEGAETLEYIPDGAMLQIYVTNKCNLRCKHCYMDSGLPLKNGECSTQERIQAIDEFAKIHPGGLVTFTGGEALLCEDIYILLRAAKDKGLRTELYSNGLLINSKNIGTISELVDDLQISLDGATSKVHEAVRGKRTFRPTLKAIRIIDRASETNHAFNYRLTFTLTMSNWHDIERNLSSLMRRLDLKSISRVQVGTASGVGRAVRNKSIYSSADDMKQIESRVMHSLAMKGVLKLPIFSINRFSKTCGHGATIAVAADGKIYPCNIVDQPDLGKLIDLKNENIFRRIHKYIKSTSVDDVDGCRKCSIRYFCGGMCRITNLKRMGSFNISACTPEYKNAQIRSLARRYESFRISATQNLN